MKVEGREGDGSLTYVCDSGAVYPVHTIVYNRVYITQPPLKTENFKDDLS